MPTNFSATAQPSPNASPYMHPEASRSDVLSDAGALDAAAEKQQLPSGSTKEERPAKNVPTTTRMKFFPAATGTMGGAEAAESSKKASTVSSKSATSSPSNSLHGFLSLLRKPQTAEERDEKEIKYEAWRLLYSDATREMREGDGEMEIRQKVGLLKQAREAQHRKLFSHRLVIEREIAFLVEDLLASHPNLRIPDNGVSGKEIREAAHTYFASRFEKETDQKTARAILRHYEQQCADYESYRREQLTKLGQEEVDVNRQVKDEMGGTGSGRPEKKEARKTNKPTLEIGRELGLRLWCFEWRDDLITQKLTAIYARKMDEIEAVFEPRYKDLYARKNAAVQEEKRLTEMIDSGEYAESLEKRFQSQSLPEIRTALTKIDQQLTKLNEDRTNEQKEFGIDFSLHKSDYRRDAANEADAEIRALFSEEMSIQECANKFAETSIEEARQNIFKSRLDSWRRKNAKQSAEAEAREIDAIKADIDEIPIEETRQNILKIKLNVWRRKNAEQSAAAEAREIEAIEADIDEVFSPTRSKHYRGMSKPAIAMSLREASKDHRGYKATKEQQESDELENRIDKARLGIERLEERNRKTMARDKAEAKKEMAALKESEEWDSDGSEEMELMHRSIQDIASGWDSDGPEEMGLTAELRELMDERSAHLMQKNGEDPNGSLDKLLKRLKIVNRRITTFRNNEERSPDIREEMRLISKSDRLQAKLEEYRKAELEEYKNSHFTPTGFEEYWKAKLDEHGKSGRQ
jgi:hypothetical protein